MFMYKVFAPDGRCMMTTTVRSCAYKPEVEKLIKKAGYKIKVADDEPAAKKEV